MQIRPIQPGEIDTFAAFGNQPGRATSVRDYLQNMFDQGAMRAEWCHVAEDEGQFVGRIGYWTLPGMEKPLDFVLLDVWDGDFLDVGGQLLGQSLREMRDLGAHSIGHALDDPPMWPQWQEHRERRIKLLESVGFTMERETARFDRQGDGDAPRAGQRLTYRALDDVGEDAFVAALAKVSADSLDQRTREERERSGPDAEARKTFAELQSMEYESGWWRLAYTGPGELVGLVMPTVAPTFGTIGYIGVVPGQRGHGYINDLLAEGTRILRATGQPTLRADTDVSNTPMADAFRRAGWDQFATRREYSIDLATL